MSTLRPRVDPGPCSAPSTLINVFPFRSSRKSTLINSRMTPRICRILVILVDRDIAVGLETNKLSIILSFHLYLAYLY